jgi:hypothetical protein
LAPSERARRDQRIGIARAGFDAQVSKALSCTIAVAQFAQAGGEDRGQTRTRWAMR